MEIIIIISNNNCHIIFKKGSHEVLCKIQQGVSDDSLKIIFAR